MYKYKIIKKWLKDTACKQGITEKMPSVREIASRFSVSVSTVLHALDELEHEKVLRCRQGAGIVALRPDSIESSHRVLDDHSVKKVIFACVDFPDEGIWKVCIRIEQKLNLHDVVTVNYRIHEETTLEQILDFTKEYGSECVGLIIYGFSGMVSPQVLEEFGRLPFRVAMFNFIEKENLVLPENCLAVSEDLASGAKAAAECLVRYGHTRIGYIRNEPYSYNLAVQIEGFRSTLLKLGIRFGKDNIFSQPVRPWVDTMAVARAIVSSNMGQIRRMGITALFVASAYGACAIIDPIRKTGLNVPESISVIANGDNKMCQYMSPPITIVKADNDEMIGGCVDFIMGKNFPSRSIKYKQHLVERESVADLN